MDHTKPKRFVAWLDRPSESSTLARPSALISAAPAESVAAWRFANPWADQIPCAHFASPQSEREARGYRRWAYCEGTARGVHEFVGNAPPDALPTIPTAYQTFPDAARALVNLAAAITREARGPVWEIQAGASEGILALGIATERGGCAVALGNGKPSLLLCTMAHELGISVSRRALDVPEATSTKHWKGGER